MRMFGECSNIGDALVYARRLQKIACCYGTEEGDGRQCDCKFLREGQSTRYNPGSEQTGCCEARALIYFLEGLRYV